MALQQNINIPVGINLNFKYTDFNYCTKNIAEQLENAYIRIDNLGGNKNKITLDIGIYTQKDGIKIMSDNQEFMPSVFDISTNFIKQGYEYLKTIDKYKNAVDLLDEGQSV